MIVGPAARHAAGPVVHVPQGKGPTRMKTTSQGARRASLSSRLPNISIVPIDIAYEVVAHILQSRERARYDFLEFGREGRLHWWKLPPSSKVWVEDPELVARDFLKLCELVAVTKSDDQEYLYLAVRGEINDDVDWTIEVNGEPLRLLLKDQFGLSRDDLVSIYPSLGGRKRRKEAKQQKRAKDLMREFWGDVGPSEDVTDDMVHQEFKAREIKNPPSVDTIARARGHRD